jgi:hypothetical protein
MDYLKCICGNNILQTAGKKAKVYCSDSCRQKAWQKKRRQELALFRGQGGVPLPPDYVEMKNVAIVDPEGGKPKNIFAKAKKSVRQPKSPNTAPKKENKAVAPKKKIEVKEGPDNYFMGELVPAGLSGIDLSIWKAEIKEKNKK